MTIPSPSSRRVPAIASASRRIATDASASDTPERAAHLDPFVSRRRGSSGISRGAARPAPANAASRRRPSRRSPRRSDERRHVLDCTDEAHVRGARHLRGSHGDLLRREAAESSRRRPRRAAADTREMETSPVPGGMSTSNVSNSPQWTSRGTARAPGAASARAPHHGLVLVRKKPIDMSFSSSRTGGTIRRSTTTSRRDGHRACAGSSARTRRRQYSDTLAERRTQLRG